MKAMILAAGRGERLKPISDHTPKPLVTILDKPIIFYNLENLAKAGFTEVIINIHHHAEQMRQIIGNGDLFNLNIQYLHEPELLDSGGGVLNALPYLGPEHFLLLNADIYTDYPLEQLKKQTQHSGHFVLIEKPDYFAKGDFKINPENIVCMPDQLSENHIFSGLSVLHPNLFKACNKKIFNLTREVFYPAIQKQEISGELYSGFWHEIATVERLNLLNERLKKIYTTV